MDFKIREELNRLSRTADINARTISDMGLQIKRLCNELQAVREELEAVQSRLVKGKADDGGGRPWLEDRDAACEASSAVEQSVRSPASGKAGL